MFVGANIDPLDWSDSDAELIAARIVAQAEQGGRVVLLHDGGGDRSQTLLAVRIAVPELRKRGYRFVQLDEVHSDGLVHVSSLGDDFYHFDPVRHSLTGQRAGRRFQLGDRVRVRISEVNLDERKIDLELVGVTAAAPQTERPGKGGKGGKSKSGPKGGGKGGKGRRR